MNHLESHRCNLLELLQTNHLRPHHVCRQRNLAVTHLEFHQRNQLDCQVEAHLLYQLFVLLIFRLLCPPTLPLVYLLTDLRAHQLSSRLVFHRLFQHFPRLLNPLVFPAMSHLPNQVVFRVNFHLLSLRDNHHCVLPVCRPFSLPVHPPGSHQVSRVNSLLLLLLVSLVWLLLVIHRQLRQVNRLCRHQVIQRNSLVAVLLLVRLVNQRWFLRRVPLVYQVGSLHELQLASPAVFPVASHRGSLQVNRQACLVVNLLVSPLISHLQYHLQFRR